MTALEMADLVVIAGHTLGISTDAALAQMDIAAARDALAEARGYVPGMRLRDEATAAAAGVGLVRALLRHRPFPGNGQQVAVAAGLQFLSLNGWCADLNPAATAVVVVEALASGQLAPSDAAAWLSPRLSPVRSAWKAPIAGPALNHAPRVSRPAGRVPVRRAVAGALLGVAVTGVTLLSAACSRGPDVPAVPSGGVPAAQRSPGVAPAQPATARSQGSGGSWPGEWAGVVWYRGVDFALSRDGRMMGPPLTSPP